MGGPEIEEKRDPSFQGRLVSNATNLMAAIERFLNTEGALLEVSEISRDLVENLASIHEQMEMIVSPSEPPRISYAPPVSRARYAPYSSLPPRISSR